MEVYILSAYILGLCDPDSHWHLLTTLIVDYGKVAFILTARLDNLLPVSGSDKLSMRSKCVYVTGATFRVAKSYRILGTLIHAVYF